MTFGRDQNAFTSFDQTTYQLTLPKADPEMIGKGMTYFADVLSKLSLLPKEIDEERQIIQEERRRSLSGQQRTMYYVLERLAPGSIFGQRIVIGTEETIDSVQQADFQDYYGRWYVPSNATLMVVADADPKAVVAQIEKDFGSAPKVPRPTPQDVGIKAYTESFAIVASDPEVKTEQVRITRLEPARAPTTTEPQLRDDLVAMLGVRAFNRRLEDKVAAGNTSYLSGGASLGNESGVIYTAEISGQAKPGKWQQALEELALEMQRARLYGYSEREFEDAKKEILANVARAVETEPTMPAGNVIGQWNQAVSDGEPISSAAQRLEVVQRLLPSVTLEEVGARFAKEYDPSAIAVIAILPAGDNVPTEAALLEIAAKAVAVKPEKEVVAQRASQLMEKLPQGGEVVEIAEHPSAGVWSGWLSNNVRFHYRFMDTRKNNVAVRISLIGGELHETAENRGITQAGLVAWAQQATSHLSSSDIRSLMTGKNIRVGAGASADDGGRRGGGGGGGNTDSISLTVAGDPDELEFGLQLAYLLLTEPKLEPAAFSQFVARLRPMLEQMETNPTMVGMRAVSGAPYPADVARTQPLTIEQLDRLTAPAAQAQLDQLIRTSPIEVTVIGDLPKEEALKQVAKYLGALPSRDRVSTETLAELRKLERPVGPRTISRTIPTDTPQSFVFSGFYGPDATKVDDTRLLRIASMVLSTRMVKEVREDEQLVYSIGSGFRPGTTYAGFGTISAAAPTSPDKSVRLLEKLQSMYEAMAKEGIADDELAVAKKQIANTLETQMREPGLWMSKLGQMTFEGTNLDDVMADPAAYEAITKEQVREAFARYYSPQSSMAIVIMPEAPKE
jgi:zinc protease